MKLLERAGWKVWRKEMVWWGHKGSGHQLMLLPHCAPAGWTPGSATRTPGRPPAACWSTTVTWWRWVPLHLVPWSCTRIRLQTPSSAWIGSGAQRCTSMPRTWLGQMEKIHVPDLEKYTRHYVTVVLCSSSLPLKANWAPWTNYLHYHQSAGNKQVFSLNERQ